MCAKVIEEEKNMVEVFQQRRGVFTNDFNPLSASVALI